MGLKLANKESLGYLHQGKGVSITSSVFHNVLRQSNWRIYVDKQSHLNYWMGHSKILHGDMYPWKEEIDITISYRCGHASQDISKYV